MLTIQADLKRYIQTSVQNLAKEVEATMRSNAPVYNGELIASIRTLSLHGSMTTITKSDPIRIMTIGLKTATAVLVAT